MVLAVAESASYTRAAQKLHVTQPAVSRQLVALEEGGAEHRDEVNGLALTRSLVRDGVGAMFLARTGLRGAADTAAFGFAHIQEPVMTWTLYAAVRKYGQLTLAARLLMRMIRDQVVDLVEGNEWHGKLLVRRV